YEDATPYLVSLSKNIKGATKKINDYIESFKKQNSDHLSEQITTYRNNRVVVLVKKSSKSAIKGIIHDESSSHQTLFVEPSALIELNNELQSLEYQRNAQINIILEDLTLVVKSHLKQIINNFKVISNLNIVYAKAQYTMSIKGIIPTINKDSAKLEIYQGAHPLIAPSKVIRNDFFMCNDEKKHRIVLISGSNTGGKTLSMKMVGLFSLMVQSGIGISALSKSNLPIYSNIFVDIGDEQSIEASLSTFSSHLLNVAAITKNVTPFSLVLLDELGSGTDPSQGENLALAIIEYLYQKDASIIVTTHYNKLKNYAISSDYIKSASVLFDEKSNLPQYQLVFDTYASSNAFEIAQILGLEKSIVDQAKQLFNDSLTTS
ncbi:MAG: endonuclease MutS2, partial [Bacilli bacterium]